MLFPAISTAERTCCRSAPGEVGTVAQFAGEGESQGGDPRPCERGTPNFDTMIEHGSRLAFPMVSMQSMVHGTETPALAFAEGTDSIGLICWLLRDQMQARINAGIDEVADDKNALDERQRADMTAQITADELLIQRAECSLIWHAEAQGEIIDFRADTSPLALLGIQLRTAPAINPSPGTSRDHGYDVVYGRRG